MTNFSSFLIIWNESTGTFTNCIQSLFTLRRRADWFLYRLIEKKNKERSNTGIVLLGEREDFPPLVFGDEPFSC